MDEEPAYCASAEDAHIRNKIESTTELMMEEPVKAFNESAG
jgi:hypothetical protein